MLQVLVTHIRIADICQLPNSNLNKIGRCYKHTSAKIHHTMSTSSRKRISECNRILPVKHSQACFGL